MAKPLRLLGPLYVVHVSKFPAAVAEPPSPAALPPVALAAHNGLEEVGNIHRHAADVFAASLANGQSLIQDAHRVRPLTSAQSAALQRLNQVYLRTVLACEDAAGAALLNGLRSGRPLAPIGAAARRRLDEISAAYLQRVRDLLPSKEQVDGEKGTESVGDGAAQPSR